MLKKEQKEEMIWLGIIKLSSKKRLTLLSNSQLMVKKTSIILSAFILLIASCNSEQQNADFFDYGKIENGTYSNDFFNFNITLPEDWYIQSKDNIVDKVKNIYKDRELTGNSQNLQKSIEKIKPSTIKKVVLLNLFRYNIDSTVDFNQSFSVAALNLKNDPNTKSGKDCINQIIEASNSHSVKRTTKGEPKLTKIGSLDFYEITMEIEINQIVNDTVKQRYCACVINGFNFLIIMTYITDEQLSELNEVLATTTFNKSK